MGSNADDRDAFGMGRHIYTFENRCIEDNSIALNDGTVKCVRKNG